jgi:chemosensory pili system protein ChpA (sensor histidine kinase/response regulator)
MDVATEFDIGPLTWVKSEVDLALQRADLALQQFSEGVPNGAPGDLTQITFCRTHLHQVQGALTLVGLEGVTRFAEAVELLLEAIAQQKRPADSRNIALARHSLTDIRRYLDGLIDGQPDQPLRLFPLYREVQMARGLEKISATDLFFPDLTSRPPRREVPLEAMDPVELKKKLHLERARFQRGLLGWLKTPKERAGVDEMLSAVRRIEATQELPLSRAFWWVAGGFLAALADGALPNDVSVKQLCTRIDMQIRHLLEGSKNIAERLMRDTLYLVALADSSDPAVQQVKAVYRLQPVMASTQPAPPALAPLEVARRHLGEVVAAAEESWSKFCTGTPPALPAFREQTAKSCLIAEQLGHTDLRRLVRATAAAANWVSEQPARHSEAMAMEVATAIILAQKAQENFPNLGTDFAHQVDVMVARIHGCIAQNPPLPGSEIPALDDMSRRAQEKLLVAQVAKEIQYNLAQIEPVLDAFFRGEGKGEDLNTLDALLNQVIGALSMMRHEGAVEALRQCSTAIKRFAAPDYVPQEADFEQVAERLSALGFYVDSLPHGGSDFESFVRGMQPASEIERAREAQEKDGAFEKDEGEQRDESTEYEQAAQISVEQEVEPQKREAHALLEAVREHPNDQGLRDELKQNLATLTPSGAAIPLVPARSEAIDAELLAIFLEEAREVIGEVDAKLTLLAEQPHYREALTHLRRSFHTLKGSGRMVGLKDLGEVAWAVEQVLNLWLRQELEVASPLLNMLESAHSVFLAWIEHLEHNSAAPPDTARLVALTHALRSGDDSAMAAALSMSEAATPASAASGAPAALEPEDSVHSREIAPLEFLGSRASAEVPLEPLAAVALDDLLAPLDLPDFDRPPAELPTSPEGLVADSEVLVLARIDEEQPIERESLPVAPEENRGENSEKVLPLLPLLEVDAAKADPLPTQLRISVSATLNEIFLEEASGHLATLRHELSALELDPGQAQAPEMHRAAHTLGGIAGTVGLMPINQLGLALEHALLRRAVSISSAPRPLPEQAAPADTPTALETIGQAIAELERMLLLVRERGPLDAAPHRVAALDSLYATPLDEQLAEGLAEHLAAADAPTVAERAPQIEQQTELQEGGAEPEVPEQELALQAVVDELDEQVLPIFLEEAIELNQKIAAKLRAWRANPADGEVAHTLARLLHTLKGSARMAGAMNLGEITHAIETRVEETRRSGVAPLELIDEIDSAFDAICQIVDRLLRGELLDLPALKASLKPTTVQEALSEAPPSLLAQTGEMAHEGTAERAMLRVRADLIDRLVNEAGELSIARSRIEGEMRSLKESLLDLTENVTRLRRQLREIEIQAESQMQSHAAHATQADEQHPGFDPLEFDRFTRFQELTRMMAESVNDVGTVQQILLKNVDEANAAILAQARLNRELQQELMNVRMVPFNSVSDRFYRTVRQTSKELGKRANLDIKGGQLEIDRSVLEKMAAPLEHMLRNAIAHGLETPEARGALGKPEIGEIVLALTQEGNQIILSLSDDGGGLDFARVRERGIAAGLISPNKTSDAAADTAALVDLIFAPGLSTASELSQIAGRGVGLDVVKTEVTSLGGRIEVSSISGQGTTFRLYIPLTLALTQALLVRTGSKLYAIPSAMIAQLLDLKEAAFKRIRDAGEAEWMGLRYPFSFLPHLLGDPLAFPETHRQYWVLLLRSGGQRLAVQIDEPKGNQEIVVKNVGPQLARVPGIDGATVLGNGQVILILNPIALTRPLPSIAFASPAGLSAATACVAPPAVPTILVVDDSLTVRKFTTRLLTREGYQVLTAKDGIEALEHLTDIIPDVMLVDIEMPRMDGFDLTRNVRADERLKNIPIIIITSRTADKHRNYAFEIGVNQYLGKPYREDELLQLVDSYVKRPSPANSA